ncbi:MAG TPA: NADH-quinone oxidoreductase subunit M [Gemmatimonadales bacterium]|nr:NADH-quinone oxidoreductase subunit M [Gemmatimonadales bacterium]
MTEFLAGIGYGHWILHALILLPLIGVVPILLVPPARARQVAFWIALAEFVLSLGLWWAFDPQAGGMQFASVTSWVPRYGISYRVGIDGLSLVLVLLTTGLVPLCVLSSWHYIAERQRGYYALLMTLLTGMLGVFISLDLFVFYVFWEVMLLPMYFLIGIWGGQNRLYATLKFFVYTFIGSLLMLVAILVLVVHTSNMTGLITFSYDDLLANAATLGAVKPWLFGAFALAFAIKVPVFPFHTWLPDAHVEAPTAGSVLLAAVLLKMGAYGFLRFAIPFFPDVALSPAVTAVVLPLAVIGIIYGALVAMVQPDFKKLVAYSSVSHLGFVILGIWACTLQSVQGAIIIMLSHGLATGALFFIIGMLYERRHTRLIGAFGGLARVMPVFAALFTIVAFASIGLPGTSGFIGEFLVLLGSFGRHPAASAIAVTVVIFAAAYLLWALQRIIYEKLDKPENEKLKDLSLREFMVLAPLVAGILWIGLYPAPVLRRVEPAARRYLELAAPAAPRAPVYVVPAAPPTATPPTGTR